MALRSNAGWKNVGIVRRFDSPEGDGRGGSVLRLAARGRRRCGVGLIGSVVTVYQ